MKQRTLRSPSPRAIDPVFLRDVLAGMAQPDKHLPCKYFYDQRGSDLFDRICDLPEYYPTRCETAILERHAGEMAALLGRDCTLIEYGSGSGRKTRLLLERLEGAPRYIPVDVSRDCLYRAAQQLARDYPHIAVTPLCADFTRPFTLPREAREGRRAVYFSGSTIGNFLPGAATLLLRDMVALVGPEGGLLIGADLKKPRSILEPAYNDSQGVTALFNLNLLARINRELGADFVLENFHHRAFYNEEHGRIEIHLVSLAAQTVRIASQRFDLEAGETICTEYSHKYSPADFRTLAAGAGLRVLHVWTDAEERFSVQYLSPSPP
jgi:dimethylhistidine N-methyltransferase